MDALLESNHTTTSAGVHAGAFIIAGEGRRDMNRTCPHCGGHAPGMRRVPDDTFTVRRVHLATGAAEQPDYTYHEHRQPARVASVAGDVVTPALQALVTGVASSVVAILPVQLLDLSWHVMAIAGALAFAGSWLVLLAEHRRQLWHVERYERDDAPAAPPVEPQPVATRLAVTLGNVHHERDLPIEPDKLRHLARMLAGGAHAFSERELAGRGKPLNGRSEYEQLRSAFLAMGWLRWKSETDRRQGLELTSPGRAGLRALADGRLDAEDVLD